MLNTLKNPTSGQVIVIVKLMKGEDNIAYEIYDNGIHASLGVPLRAEKISFDMAFVPPTPMNYHDLVNYISTQTVLQAYPGFVESEDTVNWVHEKGSTGLDTSIRVMIPSELIGKELYTESPLDYLIQSMSSIVEWSTRGEKYVVQYLEDLLPEHEAILESYLNRGVVIDRKV